jgi:hypothetical protein
MNTSFSILKRIRSLQRSRHDLAFLTENNSVAVAADRSDRLLVLFLRSPNDQLQVVVLKARHSDLRA